MKKAIGYILAFCCLSGLVTAQQPAGWETEATWREAMELFDHQKYGAAEEKLLILGRRLNATQAFESGNGMAADVAYYQGLCAYNLLRANAGSLLADFISRYPNHPGKNPAQYYLAKLHFIKKEFREAIPHLEEIEWNQLDKDQASDARFMLGWAYFQAGDKDKAAGIFRIAKNIPGEKQSQAAYYYSVISYEREEYAEALPGLESLKNSNEKFAADIPVMLANCYLKLGRTEQLMNLISEMESSGKTLNPEFYLVAANSWYDAGNYRNASEQFHKYLSHAGTLDRWGNYRLAYSQYKLRDYANARQNFEKTLRPEDSLAQSASYYLGQCFLRMENFENARLVFRKAWKIKGNDEIAEDALYEYGKISFTTRYFEDALVAFQELQLSYPNSHHAGEARELMGEILLYSGKPKEAIEYFEKSPLKNERGLKAYQRAAFAYGSELFGKNLYEKSAEYFKKALNQRADPSLTQLAYFWYAETLYRMGDYDNAIGYYLSFTELPNASKSENYGKALYGIAFAYFRQKKYELSGKYFEKFIALADRKENPEVYVDALLRAGDCAFIRKRYDEALNYYSQVRDFNDRQADYAFYQLGLCYHRKENYPKAIENFGVVNERYRKSAYRDKAIMMMADIYGSFLEDWKNCGKYANMLIQEYPRNAMLPTAYILSGAAAANQGDKPGAIEKFKTVVLEYGSDKDHAIQALDNLSNMMPHGEYDKVMKQYRDKYPEAGGKELCAISYRTGYERFAQDNFSGALQMLSDYISNCKNGEDYYDALFYRGLSYEKTGDTQAALADYEKVFSVTPLDPHAEEALIHAADIQYAAKNYLTCVQLFSSLDEIATKQETRQKARFGKAQSYFEMNDYRQAHDVYLTLWSDANTTQFSREKAQVKVGVCKYLLGEKDEAYKLFTEIEKANKGEFGAESQYYICRILYDQQKFEESITAGLYLKDNFPSQPYWRAKTFLILIEDFLLTDDTLAATENLSRLMQEKRFPDVQEQAKRRYDTIMAVWNSGEAQQGLQPGSSPANKEGDQ